MACANKKVLRASATLSANENGPTNGIDRGSSIGNDGAPLENHHTGFLIEVRYVHAGTSTDVFLEHSPDGGLTWFTAWTKNYTGDTSEVLSPLSAEVPNLLSHVRVRSAITGAGDRTLAVVLHFERLK
jgi:hypothetical protein